MTAVASTQNEVSGMGTVQVFKNGEPFQMRRFKAMPPDIDMGLVFVIDDVSVLNVGSYAYTEIDPVSVAQYAASTDPERVKLWWHRHPLNGWSQRDEKTARDEPLGNVDGGEIVQWALAIVFTPGMGWIGRYDQWNPGLTINIPVYVEGLEQFEPQVQAAVADLIKRYEKNKPTHTHSVNNAMWESNDAMWESFTDYYEDEKDYYSADFGNDVMLAVVDAAKDIDLGFDQNEEEGFKLVWDIACEASRHRDAGRESYEALAMPARRAGIDENAIMLWHDAVGFNRMNDWGTFFGG